MKDRPVIRFKDGTFTASQDGTVTVLSSCQAQKRWDACNCDWTQAAYSAMCMLVSAQTKVLQEKNTPIDADTSDRHKIHCPICKKTDAITGPLDTSLRQCTERKKGLEYFCGHCKTNFPLS